MKRGVRPNIVLTQKRLLASTAQGLSLSKVGLITSRSEGAIAWSSDYWDASASANVSSHLSRERKRSSRRKGRLMFLATGVLGGTALTVVVGLAMHPTTRAARVSAPITTATLTPETSPSAALTHKPNPRLSWIDFGGVRVLLEQLTNGKRRARAEKVPSSNSERVETGTEPP